MAADVVTVDVGMSEPTLAYSHAKAVELDMGLGQYLEFAARVCNELPSSLLFLLSSGVPVRFSAHCDVGCCDDACD